MMNGYFKLCKATYSADEHPDVVFLKHNVHDDELGESTDLAKRLGIRVCLSVLNAHGRPSRYMHIELRDLRS